MPVQGSEFLIKEAVLTADREIEGKGGIETPVDLRLMIGEVSIFESLEKPYLTVNLAVVDTQEVISEIIEIKGTERIKLTMSTNEEEKNKEFTLHLRVVSIVNETRPNDYTKAYAINCISEYAYDDANVKLSRSYTGQLEDIAENVLDNYLDVDVKRDKKYWMGESIQERVKVIVPYISPLDTVSWLIERACMDDASPIFMWATVWDTDKESGKSTVQLGDLGTMVVEGVKKLEKDKGKNLEEMKRTFVYSRAQLMRLAEKRDYMPLYEDTKTNILDFTNGSGTTENTLKMMNEGALGSRMGSLDTYTTQKIDRHFNLKKFLETWRKLSTAKDLAFAEALDDDNRVKIQGEEKNPVEEDSRYRHVITSYGTYEWENSYHDMPFRSEAVNKIRKGVMKNLLYREVMDVTLSGYNFMFEELSVGDTIGLQFKKTYTEDKGATNVNSKDSGVYMILSLRHIFLGNTHRVVATCGRIGEGQAITE